MEIEKKLASMGIQLPVAPKPVANYLPFRISGNLIFLAGSICMKDGNMVYTGAVGSSRTETEGYDAARLCALNQLAILKQAIGGLDRVVQMISLSGFVWSDFGYTFAPKILNGASDLFVEVFGERGKHSRTAVCVAGLPAGSTVEVSSIWEFGQ